MSIPEIWQREIDAGTEFGRRAALAVARMANRPQATPKPVPDLSTVGTQIRQAIETAGAFVMTCGACKQYLASLNKTASHDAEQITDSLLTELQLPATLRSEIGNIAAQREWLRVIVSEVIQ